jgi:hypothetical protein
VSDRPLILHVAGVQRRGRLEEQDVDLLVCNGAVFDPTGHDQELALFQPFVAIPELHAKAALHHEEEFVLVVVFVPDELTQELDQLHLLAVQFPDDLRTPVFAE